ncbi:MAG: class I SAM-dependent methyltransferase [Xenococcaceae cyanobacterium]
MYFFRILTVLIVGISTVSFNVAGYTLKQDSKANAQIPADESTKPVSTPTIVAQDNPGDVPYVPTPMPVVKAMLELAQVNKDDLLYDLGSGDGRIPITAAQKYGTRSIGIDIDPEMIEEANAKAQRERVSDRVKFVEQDLFDTNLKDATVVTLYLLPSVNSQLRPKLLRELRPGTRIVSHSFDMGDWKPERTVRVNGSSIYLWVVPQS